MPEPVKFEGWIIPSTRQSVSSAAKTTVHEYRWVQGGRVEDHGRGLYTFRFSATFTNDRKFSPPLFPDTLNALRRLYELRSVGTLELPDIGRVPCRITEWDEERQGGYPTSSDAQITFLEEEGHRFLGADATRQQARSLRSATDNWAAVVDDARPTVTTASPIPDVRTNEERAFDLFDQITAVANSIIALRDQQLLYGELMSSKIESILNLFEEADRSRHLNNPDNWAVVYALKELWSTVIESSRTTQTGALAPRVHIVQQTSTVMQLSNQIYGNTARAGDLLALNSFDEAMAIPAGTKVVYLPEAA